MPSSSAERVLKLIFAFSLLLPAGTVAQVGGCAEGARTDSRFSTFWSGFRRALMTEDYSRVEELTRFPFETFGDTDSESVERFERARFSALLPMLLDQDSGLSEAPETMREYIKHTSTLDDVDATQPEVHVGAFVFIKNGCAWQFARGYVARSSN